MEKFRPGLNNALISCITRCRKMGHLMEPKLIIDPLDVDAHLAAMGLDRHGLIMAVRYAEAERALCTDNDPIGFANLMAYGRAARKLREYYPPRDQRWSSDNSFNQAAIRNEHTRVRIVPCNFDEAAGDRRATPTNRSPKGEVSRHKSACNRTAWMSRRTGSARRRRRNQDVGPGNAF